MPCSASSWVQVLGCCLRSLGASIPSYPLVVASVVFCTWRPGDSGPLLDSAAGWHYDAGDHRCLHSGDEP